MANQFSAITIEAYRILLRAKARELPVAVEAIAAYAAPGVVLASYAEYAARTGIDVCELSASAMPDGFTFARRQNAHVILYNEQKQKPRRRFTIAHEIGHIALKHQKHGSAEEEEANFFAAQLLMPDAVLRFVRDRRQLVTAKFLQDCFGVSYTAARRKLTYLDHGGFMEAHALDLRVRLCFMDALHNHVPQLLAGYTESETVADLFGSEENLNSLRRAEAAYLDCL